MVCFRSHYTPVFLCGLGVCGRRSGLLGDIAKRGGLGVTLLMAWNNEVGGGLAFGGDEEYGKVFRE